MPKYRKKPVEVEAWQVGSDEPKPEWAKPELYSQIFDGCWIVREAGWSGATLIRWFLPEEFEYVYEVVE